MSTHLKQKLQKIEQILAQLTEESAKGKPIVVEGKKDEDTLRDLGVCGAMVTVKTGGKSFLQATAQIEALRATEVILLLDFDRRGREGTKSLQAGLECAKIRVNVKFWRELSGLIGREIQSIESLNAYLSTLKKKTSFKL